MRFDGLITDTMLVTGAGAVAYGAWMVDTVVGIAVVGILLMAGGLARGRAESKSRVITTSGKRENQ